MHFLTFILLRNFQGSFGKNLNLIWIFAPKSIFVVAFIKVLSWHEKSLHFEWTKVNQKYQKWSNLASFWKTEACGQRVIPDRSIWIRQNWWKRPKFKNSNATFLVIFKHCEMERYTKKSCCFFRVFSNYFWHDLFGHKIQIL